MDTPDNAEKPKKSKKILGNSTLLPSELWEKNADKIKEKADKYRENIHDSEDKERFENTKRPK